MFIGELRSFDCHAKVIDAIQRVFRCQRKGLAYLNYVLPVRVDLGTYHGLQV